MSHKIEKENINNKNLWNFNSSFLKNFIRYYNNTITIIFIIIIYIYYYNIYYNNNMVTKLRKMNY